MLATAEAWLGRAGNDPAPTPLHQRFIAAGRQAERRRLRSTVTAALVVVAVTISLAAVALVQWGRADSEAAAARQQAAIAEAHYQAATGPMSRAASA